MTLRAITFDWGDTLAANHSMPYTRTHRAGLTRLAATVAATNRVVPSGWLEACERDLTGVWKSSADPVRNPMHQEIDLLGILRDFAVRAAGGDLDDATRDAAVMACAEVMTETVQGFEEVAEVLRGLKQRGYRLGILSHVAWPGEACRGWFARRGWAEYLDFYSLSSDVGWIKPAPQHYQHALDGAGCAPHELLHVGDHPMRDITGGKAFGFRTCLRWTEGVYDEATLAACGPDMSIHNLRQLPAAIDAWLSANT